MGSNKYNKPVGFIGNFTLKKHQSYTKSLYCSIFDSIKINNKYKKTIKKPENKQDAVQMIEQSE